MERDRARPKKGGVRAATCALSRYWNDKWNIRNKSCKTLFSGDNTASSLWTLSRVGAPYCATYPRARGGRRTWTRLSLSPPFALHFAFPSLRLLFPQQAQPFALTTPAPSSRVSHPALFPLFLSIALLALPKLFASFSFSLLSLSLSFSFCSFVSWRSSIVLFRSPSEFPSVSFRCTKRQVASRCRWVNTGAVWAIFGRGGRKEWSYSESGSTSAPPFSIHPLTSSAVRPISPTSLPVRRCGRSDTTVQSFWSETSRNIMPPLVHGRTPPPLPLPPNSDPRYIPFFGRVRAWYSLSRIVNQDRPCFFNGVTLNTEFSSKIDV